MIMTRESDKSVRDFPDHAAPFKSGGDLLQPKSSRILIIDDTRGIHDDFRKILSSSDSATSDFDNVGAALFGFRGPHCTGKKFILDSAYQGQEAITLLERGLQKGERYAVAFVDVRMPPGLDGIETTLKLWEIDPDLQIVICTAYSDYSWDEMIERIGSSDRLVILKKPFDPVEVLQLANALTEKWSLLQETRRTLSELEQLVVDRTAHLESAKQKLENEIARRTRREHCLTLQRDVTQVLADTTNSSEEGAAKILQIICEGMRWDIGGLWSVDKNANVLRAGAFWHRPGKGLAEFKALSQSMVLARNTGLPGRVWETGQPLWIANLAEDGNFPRAESAVVAGLFGGFAFPIRLQGEVLGVIEFFGGRMRQPENDILDLCATLGSLIGQSLERKKLEEQLRHSQKMDAIGYLAGGVAHDFNNILTVILGYAQIVTLKENLDESTTEGLRQITQAAQRATSLTSQLLTFSRKQVMKMTELDLNKVTANLAKMLHRIIGEDISLQLNYCPDLVVVHADEDSLGQILMNLSVNARDAMPKGGKLQINTHAVTVTAAHARLHAEARVGDFVCLKVSDTGCGMTSEVLAHIFEPFFTTKKIGAGTGLGLATVHGIVAQHQGWIEVVSQIDFGTTFKIFLPRVSHSVQAAPVAKVEPKMVADTETILLVEDEDSVRTLARKILSLRGYRVLEANSGLAALSVWKEHAQEIDLLLTDIVMPEGVTGRDLAHRLRLERPRLNVIFTSGYDPDKSGLEAELGREVNFLPKPYSPQKLLSAVRQNLDLHPPGR